MFLIFLINLLVQMKFYVNLVLNKNFYTMKKLILSFAAIALTFWSGAQVICAGVSPNSIQGNYQFSWADPAGGWGAPGRGEQGAERR